MADAAANSNLGESKNVAAGTPPRRTQGTLCERDHINFYAEIAREARDFYRGARGRIAWKIARVDFIHGGKIVHVLEKDTEPDGAV